MPACLLHSLSLLHLVVPTGRGTMAAQLAHSLPAASFLSFSASSNSFVF